MEIELEVRTSEMNGILMSVADQINGFPALSLEISNGNVSKPSKEVMESLLTTAASPDNPFGGQWRRQSDATVHIAALQVHTLR